VPAPQSAAAKAPPPTTPMRSPSSPLSPAALPKSPPKSIFQSLGISCCDYAPADSSTGVAPLSPPQLSPTRSGRLAPGAGGEPSPGAGRR
jgi:hypothetical protein